MEEQTFDRNDVVSAITGNMENEDTKAYFDGDHERHKAVVAEVTELVEQVFGEKKAEPGFLTPAEQELRQSMYDDPRTVRQQLDDIFNPKSEAGRAYLDSNHPRHAETVQKAQILMEAKFGEEPKKDPDSRWPIHYRTSGQNVHQEGAFPVEHED